MVTEPMHIDFESLVRDPDSVFDRINNWNEPVVLHHGGQTYRLEKESPANIWEGYDPEKVLAALKARAGALKGIDRDELLRDLYAQREQGEGRFE